MVRSHLLFALLLISSAISLAPQNALAVQDNFYCNGDMQVSINSISISEDAAASVLNQDEQGFELDSHKHEVVYVAIENKAHFLKIQPFNDVKWNKENDSFPAKFRFSTDRKNWFAIEAMQAPGQGLHHLFCQRD